jgi:hypothetical protein
VAQALVPAASTLVSTLGPTLVSTMGRLEKALDQR